MNRFWQRWLGTAGAVSAALALSLAPIGGVRADTAVAPNPVNMMDCNGHSPVYTAVKTGLGGLCTDPIAIWSNGQPYRFYDNGHYVGHDEPSVKFISSTPGSGNTMTYYMQLAVDPTTAPTTSGTVTDYAELSPAPWFGLPLCDPKSYPQNPCTPDSDTNSGLISNPNGAGSAFMELQFYPPGYQPFVDAVSCDPTRYCAALTIDSLECTFGFATCNNNCIEPVNFAYLQTDGVPAGPPSPQLTDVSTLTPNAKTLLMNQGDVLAVTIQDTAQGLEARIVDRTSDQSGYIVASAANGFMNTNIADCSGTPFTFHAEYSTAQQPNQVPWAALEGGVLMEHETGHFEPCSSVTNSFPRTFTFTDGQSFTDPNVFQTCVGGTEGATATGEGPCDPSTGVCVGATTESGAACPTNNWTTGTLCEFSDANCMPLGARTITVNGQVQTVSWPVAGCQAGTFQNGDLDFDGTPYHADWPDGTSSHPTSFAYLGPFDAQGNPYPLVQFETNLGGSEILCNTLTGAGCTVPPAGAAFYPFWTIGSAPMQGAHDPRTSCTWNFGNVIAGTTTQSFGMTAEYGTPDLARYGGTSTSPPIANPQFSGACAGHGHGH